MSKYRWEVASKIWVVASSLRNSIKCLFLELWHLFRYWWQDILENIGIIPSIYFLFLALIHFFSSGEKVSFWIGTQVKNINFKTNFLLFQENPPKMAIHPIIKICGQFKIPYSNLLTNQNKVFSLLTLIFTSRFRKMLLSGNFGMENQTA